MTMNGIAENTKMVIVWRNDLKVRKGKIAAQCCHASMAFLTKGMSVHIIDNNGFEFLTEPTLEKERMIEISHWLRNSFRKIVCYVNNEQELLELHQKALESGLISHLVEDNGLTEFNGVKTRTAICIGPHFEEKFIGITDNLPLL